ncbi:class I SAM-dependent methyltransferase [Arcticibacter eurypsychrophilus]|uniref:class I SAM-dependent methyltransferase n=1 Tax=Arcticibacter eurypsychrophilus TaxID=1434752 RepID=UPI00084D7F2D|nr:class I SAM-dependent methyltransferase [Arcticibacter eurypsychrophilus]
MKRQLKIKTADNLAPIRGEIVDKIDPNAKVIEFGCGKGDLLFDLSPKIKYGLGIDKSEGLIEHAIKYKKNQNILNLDFLCEELGENYKHYETFDFLIASLFFHVIPQSQSVSMLIEMKQISNNLLICAFSRPETMNQKLLLWLDQRFSGHYRNFIAYQENGYFEGILAKTRFLNILTYNTFLPFVKIYKIS